MTSTLDAPIYRVKDDTCLIKMYKDMEGPKKALNEAWERVTKAFPDLAEDLSVWSNVRMGIKIGSEAENKYASELKKEVVNDCRIFKKKSKTLAELEKLIGNEIGIYKSNQSVFRFEKYERFGLGNVWGSHYIDGTLYLRLNHDPERNEEEIEAVEYDDYLQAYIDSKKKESK